MKTTLLMMMTLLLGTAGIAHAHTHLEKAVPADNAVLASSPEQIVLEFSEPTRLTAASVQKVGDKEVTKLGPLPKEPAAKISIPIQTLGPGKYVMNWRVIGDDNHVMAGVLRFAVQAK